MDCPYCGCSDLRVIDSRDVNDGVRRRRQCLGCDLRFTTYERVQSVGFFVIKKDGRREEFRKDKLLAGIGKACEKRPLPAGSVDGLADEVEAGLYQLGKAEISGSIIGDMVMSRLKSLDYIAYIRFASIYRDFSDLTDLKQEVDTLVSTGIETAQLADQLPLLSEVRLATLTKRRRRRG
ncbi:MAG: transcriptional regulator NrdR [Dehalococcoidales bacterium]|nr:transcriptional regulator NrdR [Dehalococcoidales bacterium]